MHCTAGGNYCLSIPVTDATKSPVFPLKLYLENPYNFCVLRKGDMFLYKKVFCRCVVLMLSCFGSICTCNVLLKCIDVMAYETQNAPILPMYEEIVFPHTDSTSGIILEGLACYEGLFFEDKSNEEVSNIAGLIIRNSGVRTVSYAKIQLLIENDTYIFEAWDVPIDAAVLILEGSKTQYRQTSAALASVSVLYTDLQSLCSDVQISQQGMGELRITNIGTSILKNLVVYHKGYDATCSLLLGGITHHTKCPDLAPGESAIIAPEYYALGYSRILWILQNSEIAADTSHNVKKVRSIFCAPFCILQLCKR